jgi:uncharacterized protein (DUF1499 family)
MTGSLLRALTRNQAATGPDADDPRLRGRTYAVPFDLVWNAALRLAGQHAGWKVVSADDVEGFLRAEVHSPLGWVDDVTVQVSLDPDAQTRVDLASTSRGRSGDLGRNARRIGRFQRSLDRELGR